ncbi:bifunctional DNA primase/polymerase [Reyranella soli]|uniref:DNA primase/polymerase bifunctional N-terminal domain-containing protein n=1 Tax=Reyranella soli TaxID=1230389 RepID=A0A512NEF8_9HYPH|nr:bifunctional DNA primase/polymerase [Reyranella soli]GEP57329.1 hypothetical protein RSO01_44950 [Reyranella soli]
MAGAYTEAAAAWVAAGIVPLPLGGADGKRPLIAHPARLGRRAAIDLAHKPRFADAPGLGFWCGKRNGLTVVDIDSQVDAEVRHAINTYGDSPVIVQTASGKAHLYYRHAGERRSIRPDKGHPIDILGEGGLAVAPPSERPTGGRYRFLRGGLDDLRKLPKIRPGALGAAQSSLRNEHEQATKAEQGNRNASMFRLARELALGVVDRDALLEQIRRCNADLADPLPDAEVQRTVGSVWRYREQGRLMVSGNGSTIIIPAESITRLLTAGATDSLALMTMARRAHGAQPGRPFALVPQAMADARLIGSWGRNRYRAAIRQACDLGELQQIAAGGRGKNDPALYCFPSNTAPAGKGV